MKKLTYIVIGLMVIVSSCRDESLDPHPLDGTSDFAPYLTLQVGNIVFDAENLNNAAFTGTLTEQGPGVTSYSISVSLFRAATGVRSDTAFVKTLTSYGDFSISAAEVATSLDSALTDFEQGDQIDFIAQFTDGTNTWRVDGPDANIGSDLFGNAGQRQAFLYTGFVACAIDAGYSGDYEMVQTQGGGDPFFGGPRFKTEIVSLEAPNLIQREWEANYVTFGVDFTVFLLCDNVVVPFTASGVGCGGPGLNWIQDDDFGLGSYDPSDDASFTINIIENVDNGCGAGVNPETIITMTKQ